MACRGTARACAGWPQPSHLGWSVVACACNRRVVPRGEPAPSSSLYSDLLQSWDTPCYQDLQSRTSSYAVNWSPCGGQSTPRWSRVRSRQGIVCPLPYGYVTEPKTWSLIRAYPSLAILLRSCWLRTSRSISGDSLLSPSASNSDLHSEDSTRTRETSQSHDYGLVLSLTEGAACPIDPSEARVLLHGPTCGARNALVSVAFALVSVFCALMSVTSLVGSRRWLLTLADFCAPTLLRAVMPRAGCLQPRLCASLIRWRASPAGWPR